MCVERAVVKKYPPFFWKGLSFPECFVCLNLFLFLYCVLIFWNVLDQRKVKLNKDTVLLDNKKILPFKKMISDFRKTHCFVVRH